MPEKTKIPILVQNDPWLSPYVDDINNRTARFENRKKEIEKNYGSLQAFASAYEYYGLNYSKKEKGWWYREWAPNAHALYLTGDFNKWDKESHPMKKNQFGVWEIFIPDGKSGIAHESAFKVHVVGNNGSMDRIPAYAKYCTQDEVNYDFTARAWNPAKPYKWKNKKFDLKTPNEKPLIYECHIGMAQEKEGIGTYKEFTEKVLPKVKEQGYNTLQVMAVQEHPYYGSFGYHVSSFFAPSSRFGTPYDLKELVDTAHGMGIAVVMDIVHSHAVKNIAEGLNEFDGTEDQYFHPGGRGNHDQWDSKLFNYGKEEVQRFLLSNVKYWIEEFNFDGYRYDGITSMLYFHHGNISFDHYDKYFNDTDWDVLTYLQLANVLAKEIKPHAILIAEDMSGMPGLCRPVEEGGLGFDFRLAMGIPDYWIKLLKHKSDEEWNIHEMWQTLSNRRYGERTIAYSESHDQALVGDKSVAFWLMDKEMYTHMHINHESLIIDRGIALHKLIRLFTISLGGEGWLNFIGNEFGHPEWVDFPREGNGWSYKYARRQWNLQEHPELRYQYLYNFGADMVKMVNEYNIINALPGQQLNMDETNHTMVYERNNVIFALNFHHHNSIPDYRFRVPEKGKYKIILNSDKKEYGGFDRLDDAMTYPTVTLFGEHFLSIYLPSRVGVVLKKV
ncbi:alpha amylase C-terminal domain-containing protein [Marinoscillum sp. MHG1-6]|uniref:alpha amylase C-terminal domain-containing protein n=1 Tax=Marinoscillum sp. MHG1-6 TaxID=2959627 RepID=UPI00215768D5|nr:alpha amylase C-terminal domain-containing protein [Marinoscillum sp. MHG1-6]